MKLPVVPNEKEPGRGREQPWYGRGLRFTCTECGNCCTGGPGFVWITTDEIVRLAEFLKLSPEEVVERYCRKLGGKFSLDERRGEGGGYDCIFLEQGEPEKGTGGGPGGTPHKAGRELETGEAVPLRKRVCSVYPVRPLQCRTWPFWPENLGSREAWDRAAERCPGMNYGTRKFTKKQVEAVRDADRWPQSPPSSAPEVGKDRTAKILNHEVTKKKGELTVVD